MRPVHSHPPRQAENASSAPAQPRSGRVQARRSLMVGFLASLGIVGVFGHRRRPETGKEHGLKSEGEWRASTDEFFRQMAQARLQRLEAQGGLQIEQGLTYCQWALQAGEYGKAINRAKAYLNYVRTLSSRTSDQGYILEQTARAQAVLGMAQMETNMPSRAASDFQDAVWNIERSGRLHCAAIALDCRFRRLACLLSMQQRAKATEELAAAEIIEKLSDAILKARSLEEMHLRNLLDIQWRLQEGKRLPALFAEEEEEQDSQHVLHSAALLYGEVRQRRQFLQGLQGHWPKE